MSELPTSERLTIMKDGLRAMEWTYDEAILLSRILGGIGDSNVRQSLVDACDMALAHLASGEAAEGLAEAAQKADDAMASWFSAEYNGHPVHIELRQALSAYAKAKERQR